MNPSVYHRTRKGAGRPLGLLSTALGILLFLSLTPFASSFAQSDPPKWPTYAELAQDVNHAVVNIFASRVVASSQVMPFGGGDTPLEDFFNRFFGGEQPQMKRRARSLGTGFILDDQGLIMTNNHVVAKADEIKVRLADQHEYDARVIGRDPKTDLALLKVKPDDRLPEPARLGDSDALRVGDQVMASGNPFGLGHTVTVGIISAKSRVIGAGPYDNFLQTDAAINPGNSGGPLFNMQGQVVGINTAIVASGQGIGFAIPINLARDLLPQLKTGKIVRGWLGVVIQDITPELGRSLDLKEDAGVLVADVEASGPAGKAGLKRGDVIKALDGNKIEDPRDLSRTVAQTRPGTKLTLNIVREGKPKDITVAVGTMPGADEEQTPVEESPVEQKWGLSLQALNEPLARRLGLPEDEKGVLATNVSPFSPAAQAGLRRGDLLKEVERKPVTSPAEVRDQLSEAGEEALLLVKRGGRTFFTVLEKQPQ